MRATLIKPRRSLITDAVAYGCGVIDFYYRNDLQVGGPWPEWMTFDKVGWETGLICDPYGPPYRIVASPDGNVRDYWQSCS